jgi:uncharacterized protein (DUF58 family)
LSYQYWLYGGLYKKPDWMVIMRLTRIFYYGLMPVVLFFGLYTGLTVFYTVLFMQILLLCAVFFIDLWTVKTFRYTQMLELEAITAGSSTVLRIKIANEKPIPLSLMEIDVDVVSMREDIKLVFSLAPFSEKSFEIDVKAPYRGSYEVGMTVVRLTDIFGLMTLRFDMRNQSFYKMARLLVYPRAEEPGAVAARVWDAKLFGASYLKQAEQGDGISGMRSYRPGDSPKRIHWKNSVKHAELYVKQYDITLREKSLIILDSCKRGLEGEDAAYYADTMCQCAASLALYSLKRGRSTGVAAAAPVSGITQCESTHDFAPIHTWLAKLEYFEEDRLIRTLEILTAGEKEACSLFVLTRHPDKQLISILKEMQIYMQSVTLILIDDEEKSQNESLHTLYINTGDNVPLGLGNFT